MVGGVWAGALRLRGRARGCCRRTGRRRWPRAPRTTNTTFSRRVVALIDSSGNVDTSTTTTAFSGTDVRTAVASGQDVWIGGGPPNGLVYTRRGGLGDGTMLTTNPSSYRYLGIFGDRIRPASRGWQTPRARTASRVNRTGTASIYLCNDLAQPMGGLLKFTVPAGYAGTGLWPLAWWIRTGFPGCRSLAARETAGGVVLYAVASNGSIVTAVDPDGGSGTPEWIVWAAAAGTNRFYRGIAVFGFRL
ncbi:hypothetical protein DFJ74DRAFT_641412 [Hyaloraphidium curvatum]|nr:hypothetical protein DFJ74DRAFT_641412 [Hyaloraphidium curvatum]